MRIIFTKERKKSRHEIETKANTSTKTKIINTNQSKIMWRHMNIEKKSLNKESKNTKKKKERENTRFEWNEEKFTDAVWLQWLASEISETGDKSLDSLLISGETPWVADINAPSKLFLAFYTSDTTGKRLSKGNLNLKTKNTEREVRVWS